MIMSATRSGSEPSAALLTAASLASQAAGQGTAMHAFCTQLYPMLRSITGQGVRDTLAAIGHHIPLTVTEVPTGTKIFDWECRRNGWCGPRGSRGRTAARWWTLPTTTCIWSTTAPLSRAR